jgi:arginine/lysine/ornithine decarboxylase
VAPAAIRQALVGHPGVAAIFALYPNYYGVVGDLAGQARIAQGAARPLLVDEAHGAHLRFHPDLPEDAISKGAAACVQSTHKLGGSLTQTSLLHLKGRLINGEGVAAALRLLETTSPSYILMASLDLARQQLALRGRVLLERALGLAEELRGRLSRIHGLRLLAQEDLPDGNYGLDLTKLVISVRGLGLTGYQVRDLLAERYRVYVEMADSSHLVAFVTIGATRKDCLMLACALEDLAAREKSLPGAILPEAPRAYNKVMRPRDAWFSRAERVALAEAGGRICAETVAVYPPGIPALYPGEEITPEIIEYLTTIRDLGIPYQGPSDPALKTLKVVVE